MPYSIAEYIPQTTTTRRPLAVWLISLAVALLIVGMIVGAPLAAATNHPGLARGIYGPFGAFCHQLPERSFFIAGHKFAVCARCSGLYGGFALLLLLYPLIRPLRSTELPVPKWLFLAAAPMAVDFSLTFFGIWENTHSSRLFTGVLLGGVTVFYVMPGLVEMSLRVQKTPQKSHLSAFTLTSAEAIAAAPSDYSAPERRI
ncbi:MAG TPA: DUF2085 domain-containing protein [Pyrinomonadaceae bacterium]